MQMRAATSPGSMVEPTGLPAKIDSITLRLARVPPSLHQLLFRLAVAGIFLPAPASRRREAGRRRSRSSPISTNCRASLPRSPL